MERPEKFEKGARVRVTDLRTGLIWRGFIVEHNPPLKAIVQRDTGQRYLVGEGFISYDND